MNRGKLIILEGPIGVGKTVQAQKLVKKLDAAHISTKLFNFPNVSNSLINKTINQIFHNPEYDISNISRLFLESIMSSETMKTIQKSLDDGIYCICESSYIKIIVEHCFLNNIANYDEISFILSYANSNLEADLTIIFDAPPSVLIDRLNRSNSKLNIEQLEKIRTGYLLEAKKHDYPIIFSTDSIESISNIVWDYVTKCLGQRSRVNQSAATSLPTSISKILDYPPEKNELNVTSTDIKPTTTIYPLIKSNQVFAVKSDLNLNIFLDSVYKKNDTNNLKRLYSTLNNFQLSNTNNSHFLFKNVSNLLISKISTNQQTLNLSTIKLDSNYKQLDYFIPGELDDLTKKKYKKTIDHIFKNYLEIVDKLGIYLSQDKNQNINLDEQVIKIAQNLLPQAIKSSIVTSGSINMFLTLDNQLKLDNLAESKTISKNLNNVFKQLLGNQSSVLNSTTTKAEDLKKKKQLSFNKLINQKIKAGFSTDLETVNLIDYFPKNEFYLLPYMLFGKTNLSMIEIKNVISKWSYEDKLKAFESYNYEDDPSKILNFVQYDFDLVSDYQTIKSLLDITNSVGIKLQDLTPRYGYDIPEIIEDAGLTEKYQECFDLSLELYSLMESKNYRNQAQYVVLRGNKIRMNVSFSARDIGLILSSKEINKCLKQICDQIKQKIEEIHPLTYNLLN